MKDLFLTLLLAGLALLPSAQAQLGLVLPTENNALLENRPEAYFQFVDRSFEGEQTTPWEGGQFGFVRDPRRIGSAIAYARFHEGLDVKPLRRDSRGDPLDEVCAIIPGQVVHVTATAGQSNYGRYIVIRHDLADAGPFYSLYAHLRESRVAIGQTVKAGQAIGLMGYTGAGIDQRRAHVHVELNMLLSSQFEAWHNANFNSPNPHGIHNGINLIGVDLQALYLACGKKPSLSLVDFIRQTEPAFRLQIPGAARMDMLERHPWLLTGNPTRKASWEVTFSRWGLPLAVETSPSAVTDPVVSWVKESSLPHYLNTRGLITGSGGKCVITAEGMRFARLACGLFEPSAVK